MGLLQAQGTERVPAEARGGCCVLSSRWIPSPEPGSSGQDLEETLPKALFPFQKADFGSKPSTQGTTAGRGLLQGEKSSSGEVKPHFPKNLGCYRGSPSSTSQAEGVEVPHSSQHLCRALQPSQSSFHGKSSAHIWSSLQDDDDNVFLLNKIHF